MKKSNFAFYAAVFTFATTISFALGYVWATLICWKVL